MQPKTLRFKIADVLPLILTVLPLVAAMVLTPLAVIMPLPKAEACDRVMLPPVKDVPPV